MSERTVAPSPRRREEARRRGEAAVSPTLAGAAGLLSATAMLGWAGPEVGHRLVALFGRATAPGAELSAIGAEAAAAFAWVVLPVAGAALLGVLVTGLLQTGGLFAPRRIASGPRAERTRATVGRGVVLLGLAAAAVLLSLRGEEAAVRGLLTPSGVTPIREAAALVGRMAARVGVALLVVGAAEFALRRLALERGLRMTRDEAARERQQEDGDPRMRAEGRRRLADGATGRGGGDGAGPASRA